MFFNNFFTKFFAYVLQNIFEIFFQTFCHIVLCRFSFLENFHSGAFYFPFPTLHLLTRHTHASGDNAQVGSVGNRWHMRPGAGARKLDMPRLVYQALAMATSTRPGGNFIF
jgi:hypothetical protein